MFPTTEIRWFFPGSWSAQLFAWLNDTGHLFPEPVRTDWYLPPTDPALGVKVRQGRVEAKRRAGTPMPVVFGPKTAGQIEKWVKWSFSGADTAAEITVDSPPGWTAVEKRRFTCGFDPAARDSFVPATVGAIGSAACRIELTAVRAKGQQWWTFGLEADGLQPDRAELIIPAALAALCHHDAAPSLPARSSFGYARWLLALADSSPIL